MKVALVLLALTLAAAPASAACLQEATLSTESTVHFGDNEPLSLPLPLRLDFNCAGDRILAGNLIGLKGFEIRLEGGRIKAKVGTGTEVVELVHPFLELKVGVVQMRMLASGVDLAVDDSWVSIATADSPEPDSGADLQLGLGGGPELIVGFRLPATLRCPTGPP